MIFFRYKLKYVDVHLNWMMSHMAFRCLSDPFSTLRFIVVGQVVLQFLSSFWSSCSSVASARAVILVNLPDELLVELLVNLPDGLLVELLDELLIGLLVELLVNLPDGLLVELLDELLVRLLVNLPDKLLVGLLVELLVNLLDKLLVGLLLNLLDRLLVKLLDKLLVELLVHLLVHILCGGWGSIDQWCGLLMKWWGRLCSYSERKTTCTPLAITGHA